MLSGMQAKAMADKFPGLRPVLDLPWVTIWEGELRPVSEAYFVRIVDHRGADDGRFAFVSRWPSVRVLSPLSRRDEAPHEPVPHLYGGHDNPRGAELCLFHPRSRDWNDWMLLADSIVPWAAEWLYYYEMWHVTGVWGGDEWLHEDPAPRTASPELSENQPSRHRRVEAPLLRSMPFLLNA